MPIYSKTPLEILCDSINTTHNPKILLTPFNVRVRKVTVIPERNPTKPNATVVLTGRQSRGLVGDVSVNVHRIDMATLFKNQQPFLEVSRNMSIRDAALLLNAVYGINLDPLDFRDDVLTGGNDFWLQPGAKSIQYTGRVIVRIRSQLKKLNALRSIRLSVLNHPVEPDGRFNLDLLSWGWDFTDDQSVVKNTPAGILANTASTAGLRKLLEERGLGELKINGARLTHYTRLSTVPTANQKYTNLSIISGIDDPKYNGSIYLHYFA